ncbi:MULTISPECIES: GNAT family N-acetyltransferase [Neobacillus]|uniref:GNAT family N-acetyltransferase n=1 Tax=Neobacillus citreus TaxID=2833578 RepID=A0A942SUL1_9BACI|nr:GNAT family N-acetyltransferase [Neobacillus citreus]
MNSLFSKVLELDLAYLDTFSNRIETSWGYLFYNENQPAYYDANHAHIHEAPSNPKSVIEEVLDFYQKRNLTPRFYIFNIENQGPLIKELYASGFRYEELVSPVQIWNKELTSRQQKNRIQIERVTEANYTDALEIECQIKEFGGRGVREKAFAVEFKHPSFSRYLLKMDGTACSTACLFEHRNQVRLEHVATLEEYRGKGLIGDLIYFLQEEVKKKGLENLWVFPIDERVENVYAKYGFQSLGKFITGHAFLSGKSVMEIRGS